MYNEWLQNVTRFKPSADDIEIAKYTDVYPKYVDQITAGMSLEVISDTLARDRKEYGLSSSDWNILFGNWLRFQRPSRNTDQFLPSPRAAATLSISPTKPCKVLAPPPDAPSPFKQHPINKSPVKRSGTCGQSQNEAAKIELATMFKLDFDSWGYDKSSVSEIIAPKVSINSSQTISGL